MRFTLRVFLIGVVLCAFGGMASADEGGAGKVDICHWDNDLAVFEVINVGAPSVPQHMANHGDVLYEVFVTENDDPIWSNAEAQGGVCAARCASEGGIFTGAWWTTIPNVASVCQCTTC